MNDGSDTMLVTMTTSNHGSSAVGSDDVLPVLMSSLLSLSSDPTPNLSLGRAGIAHWDIWITMLTFEISFKCGSKLDIPFT